MNTLTSVFAFRWLWILLVSGAPDLHPLHVSVTEIDFDEKDKALEVMMRVFIDDAEVVMRERYKKPEMDILNPGSLTVDQMFSDYTKQQFGITLDNKTQTVKYLGHEKDGDAFVLYMEVNPVKKWKTITVRNEVFTERYDDQSNLVHVTVRGNVKSLRLNRSRSTDALTFEPK